MQSRLLKLKSDERGNAMIEVSMVLPVLLLMLVGTLNIGLLLQKSMTVADSARAGAEYPTNWQTSSDTVGMQAAAVASAGNIPGYHAVSMVFCTCGPGGPQVSCSGSCWSYGTPSQYAQVTASADLPLLFWVPGLPRKIHVQSVARMRVPWTGR